MHKSEGLLNQLPFSALYKREAKKITLQCDRPSKQEVIHFFI